MPKPTYISTESVRIDSELLAEARTVADLTERTLKTTIERWIREGLKKYQEAKLDAPK